MNIQQVREQYPQYSDLTDEQLADGLYRKFYSDMDRADFMARIGMAPQGAPYDANEFVGTPAATVADGSVTMQGNVTPNPEPGAFNSFGRGWNTLEQAVNVGANEFGLLSDEKMIEYLLANEQDKAQYPLDPETAQKLQDIVGAETFFDAMSATWDQIKRLDFNAIGTLLGESAPISAPIILAGIAGTVAGGGIGAAAGAGTVSAAVEYSLTLAEELQNAGIGNDVEAIKAALADPEFMANARERGVKRGIAIGLFDALSFGLAGRMLAPVARATGGGIVGKTLGTGVEVAAQGAFGAGGEAAAQLATEGEIAEPGSVWAEYIAEVAMGAPEIVTGAYDAARKKKGDDTTVPPPASEQPEPQPEGPQAPPIQVQDNERPEEEDGQADDIPPSDWMPGEGAQGINPIVSEQPAVNPGPDLTPNVEVTPSEIGTRPGTAGVADQWSAEANIINMPVPAAPEPAEPVAPAAEETPAPKKSETVVGVRGSDYVEFGDGKVYQYSTAGGTPGLFYSGKRIKSPKRLEAAKRYFEEQALNTDQAETPAPGQPEDTTPPTPDQEAGQGDGGGTGIAPPANPDPVDVITDPNSPRNTVVSVSDISTKDAWGNHTARVTFGDGSTKTVLFSDGEVRGIERTSGVTPEIGGARVQNVKRFFNRNPDMIDVSGPAPVVDNDAPVGDTQADLPVADEPQTPQRDPGQSIGRNPDGKLVFEDENGVRSYSDSGIRVSEPVGVVPGQGIEIQSGRRGNEFKTVEEVERERAADQERAEAAGEGQAQTPPAGQADLPSAPDRSLPGGNTVESTGSPKAPSTPRPADYGSKNKIFTKEKADAARERLRAKLRNQLNSGIDPEMLADGIQLAGYHIEAGIRRFADLARQIAEDFDTTPDKLREHLPGWYSGARDTLRARGEDVSDMDTTDEVFEQLDNLGEIAENQIADEIADDSDPGYLASSDTPEPAGQISESGEMQQVSEAFRDAFLVGESFATIVQARKKAAEILGRPIEANTTDAKMVDEAIEVGVVMAAKEIADNSKPQASYDALVDLYGQQPKLGTRTSTSMIQQAYSTPVPLAFLASRLAGINAGKTVYEPTAGNGALLIASKPGNVTANELNGARRESLQRIYPEATVTGEDVSEFTPTDSGFNPQEFDAVIGNPPFGLVKDEDGNNLSWQIDEKYETNQVDHKIALQALETMKDDGRAVLIVGGLRDDKDRVKGYRNSTAKRQFYNRLFNQYNVVDMFTVDGSLYERQGAGYPVDVIVIDGRGQSAMKPPYAEAPPVFGTWDALKEKLNDTPRNRQPDQLGNTGNGGRSPDRDAAGDSGDGGQTGSGAQGGSRPSSGGGTEPASGGRRSEPDPAQTGEGVRDAGTPAVEGGDQASEAGSGRVGGDRADAGKPPARRARGNVADESAENAQQVANKPISSGNPMGAVMPRNQITALANALEEIQDQYADKGGIDGFVAERLDYASIEEMQEVFGAEQIDALALAIKNMSVDKGFILGDQTGMGKGRVVAGLLRYAYIRGNLPVFFTIKPLLYGDMYRDLKDIGFFDYLGREPNFLMTNNGGLIPIDQEAIDQLTEREELNEFNEALKEDDTLTPADRKRLKKPIPKVDLTRGKFIKAAQKQDAVLAKMKTGKQVREQYDMVFTTYSQMQTIGKGKGQGGQTTERRKFLRRIAPDSTMLLDESHAVGERKDPHEKTKEQPMSALIREVIPKTKGTVFSSATFAKRPDVMDLYATTDLRLAVSSPEKIGPLIEKGGIPMQQITTTMLSEAGQYARRERSFNGIKYQDETVKVDKGVYDDSSSALSAVLEFSNFVKAAVNVKEDDIGAAGGTILTDLAVGEEGVESFNFTSVMHNLIKQVSLSLKADAVANAAIEELKAGRKPVITVAATNESLMTSVFDDMDGLKLGDKVEFDLRAAFQRYLERTRRVTFKDVDNETQYHRLTDEELGPAGVAAYDQALAIIKDLDGDKLPGSPIDYITDKIRDAGFEVGEVTGRSARVEYKKGKTYFSRRKPFDLTDAGKRRAIERFNNETGQAIILNQSGSTGLSLHASENFKDQAQRVMLLAQAEAEINTHMQMLGRINRTGQVVMPEYRMMVADIPAELRPAAVLAKKMASLNANTTSDRKSAITSEETPDFLNRHGDRIVWRVLDADEAIWRRLDSPYMGESEKDAPDGLAMKVTGRIPLLQYKDQIEIYDQIISEYNAYIEELKGLGLYNLEAETVDLQATTLYTQVVGEEVAESSSPFAKPAIVEEVEAKILGRPFTSDQVLEKVKAELGDLKANVQGELQISTPPGDTSIYRVLGNTYQHKEKIKEIPGARWNPIIRGWEFPANQEAEAQNILGSLLGGEVEAKFTDSNFPEMLHQIGAQKTGEMAQKAREEFHGWREAALADMKPEAAQKFAAALLDGQTHFNLVMQSAPIGASVQLRTDSGNIYGVVTKIARTGKTKNPLAASAWKMTIALAAPEKQITLPFSRLGGEGAQVQIRRSDTMGDQRVWDLFDQFQGSDRKERRTIVTGNILRGYEFTRGRGRITYFSRKDGKVVPGILMPRDWEVEDALSRSGVVFKTAKDATEFLMRAGYLQTREADVQIRKNSRDEIKVTVPKSKKAGGRYALNDKVRNQVDGREFVNGTAYRQGGEKEFGRTVQALMDAGAVFEVSPRQDGFSIATEIAGNPIGEKKATPEMEARKAKNEQGGGFAYYTPKTQVTFMAGRKRRSEQGTQAERGDRPIKTPQDLVDRLRDAMPVKAGQGRLPMQKAVGAFNTRSHAIRLRSLSNLDIYAHELGHFLEAKFSGVEGLKARFSEEIEGMSHDPALEGDALRSEGFAEFFRNYTLNKAYARRHAPGFYEAFDRAMRDNQPDFHKAIQEVHDEHARYIDAPSQQVIADGLKSRESNKTVWAGIGEYFSSRNRAGKSVMPAGKRGLRNALPAILLGMYKGTLAQHVGISALRDQIMDLFKVNHQEAKTLEAVDDPEVTARRQKNAVTIASADLAYGILFDDGNRSVSMTDVLTKAVGENNFTNERMMRDFGGYLVSRRAVYLWDQFRNGERPSAPTKETRGDHLQNLGDMEAQYPGFEEAAAMYDEFMRGLLRLRAEEGIISGAQYKDLLERDPHYTPFKRWRDDLPSFDQDPVGRPMRPLARLKGSERDIIDPIETSMQMVLRTRQEVEQNKVKRQLVELAREAGGGSASFLEEVSAYEPKVERVWLSMFTKSLVDLTGLPPEHWEKAGTAQILESIADHLNELEEEVQVAYFKQVTTQERDGEPLVFWRENGELRAFVLNGDDPVGLAAADTLLNGFNKEVANIVTQVMGPASTLLRQGVTTSPSYVLANLVRDFFVVYAQEGAIPGLVQLQGAYEFIVGKDLKHEYEQLGGIMTGIETGMIREVDALSKAGHLDPGKFARVKRNLGPRGFFRNVQLLSEYSETFTRLGLYKKFRREAMARGLDEMAAAKEAAYRANDFIDYSRYGDNYAVVTLRHTVPFLNAAIQGLDKFARVMPGPHKTLMRRMLSPWAKEAAGVPLSPREKRQRKASYLAAARLTSIGILGLMLGIAQEDDEDYQEANDYYRYNHWLVRYGNGENEFFAIPKPWEYAAVSTILERGYAYAKHQDPRELEKMRENLLRQFFIGEMPSGIIPHFTVPLIEYWANRSMYFDGPLIPEYIQADQNHRQATSFTSEFSKSIAKYLYDKTGGDMDVSPLLIDHFITGYGGTVARDVLSGIDSAVFDKDRGGTLSDSPVVRRFVKDWTVRGQSQNEFFNIVGKTGDWSAKAGSLRDDLRAGDWKGAAKFLDSLDPSEKHYALWKQVTGNALSSAPSKIGGKRPLAWHPLERAKATTKALRATMRAIDDGDIADVPSNKQGTTRALMREWVIGEYRNALIESGAKGYEKRKPIDTASIQEKLDNISPAILRAYRKETRSKPSPRAMENFAERRQIITDRMEAEIRRRANAQ
ncbi:MAG: strawberry notch C-terminal domain-containing protein [Alphaproteobacteria bacterium]|nr:strawberry notch C-terminal domain-containing protein [Alphaproteobacteria bacterium]